MKFQTRYTHEKSKPEINTGLKLVEKAGYIPAKIRIENMINAGQRLLEHRAQLYDFPSNQPLDENYFDPTRSKNFDMADAFILQQSVLNNVRSKEALKASQTAQNVPDDVPPIDRAPE